MEPPHADRRPLAPALFAVLVAVLLALSLVPLGGELRDAGATLEQLLPAAERARMAEARAPFSTGPEPALVVLEGDWSEDRVDALVGDLASLPDVRGVTRVTELATLTDAPDLSFLRLELHPTGLDLAGARRIDRGTTILLDVACREGERAYALGLPRMRAASWDLARSELGLRLPLLVALALLLPWLFVGSAGAGALALLLAAATTALTLWTYRLVAGPPSTLILLVIPLLWAVATLDALHLAGRVAGLAGAASSAAARARRARAELFGPCLVTTLTTAAGFLGLGTLGPSGLLRGLGLASALGVVVAFLLTFTLGTWLVAWLPLGAPPRWPRRFALRWIGAARRAPRTWIAAWGVAVALGLAAFPGLGFGGSFPRVFSDHVPVARDLDHLARELDTDLAPIEVILLPADDGARRAPNLVGALAALSKELRTLPGVRAVLPLDALADLPVEASAGLSFGDGEDRLARELGRPELAPWVDPDLGTARLEVHFERGASWAHKDASLGRLRSLDRGLLGHYELTFAGTGYAAFRVEELGLQDLRGGGLVSLAILALVLVVGMALGGGGLRTGAIALASSLLPLCFLPAGLALGGIPWSMALLPLPSLLLGLAVDDSVHLAWRSRGRLRLGALPAITATTVLVVACVGTLATSGLRANRDLGLLLAGGLVVALAADLTLLPALTTRLRRRAPR